MKKLLPVLLLLTCAAWYFRETVALELPGLSGYRRGVSQWMAFA